MLPSSRPTDTQQPHAQRTAQFSSIIRTRSQQQCPLPPVDMYASPLKEAIRNHNHNQQPTHQVASELEPVYQKKTYLISDNTNDADEMLLSPLHKKRASSPSFARDDYSGKRTRVLGNSSKLNFLSRRHSDESLGTPRKDIATPDKVHAAQARASSYASPAKGITHIDLAKIPSSPAKPPKSPAKTFKITLDNGHTMRVPTTPARRLETDENVIRTPRVQACPLPQAREEHVRVHSPPRSSALLSVSMIPSTPVIKLPTPQPTTSSKFEDILKTNNSNMKHMLTPEQLGIISTPVRPTVLREKSFLGGSPLTPLPSTPHPISVMSSQMPGLPSHGSTSIVPNSTLFPSPSLGSVIGGVQTSPSKSRIPVPSSSSLSRLPRPPSSLSISTLPAGGSSSPAKVPSRPSPVKSKTRTKGKVRSGIRSKAPVTRLAAKRGLRRTSSSLKAQHTANLSSTVSNVFPSSELTDPSHGTVNATIPPTIEKDATAAFLRPPSENASKHGSASSQLPSGSTLGSPKKSTPLKALSTALQKLLSAPPIAPVARPRSNTSLGFSRSSLVPTQAQALPAPNCQDNTIAGTATSEKVGLNPVGPRPKTSLGHAHTHGTQIGLGKMGLPLRRPTITDISGRSTPWTGAAFASKQTTLSTVPASPSRSAVLTEANASSIPQKDGVELLDVDSWDPNNRVKGKEKDEMGKNEYLIPLADEPRALQHHPPGELVSPSRRASQASISLTRSLSLPRAPVAHPLPRSASTSKAVRPNPRTPVKTRGSTKPPSMAPLPAQDGGAAAKPRSNARMPGSLDVLKNCVIFVDVRTEDGEDAAALFVDMLRGLGARILAKPGKSCTHLVYKAGLPSTITKYKLLPEPRPLAVSIGWVVECVEKRAHADETRFMVNLNEIGVAGGVQRRRSMQPKQMRTLTLGQLESGESADISVRADSSFASEELSTSGVILTNLSPPARSLNNLPPLERARQRSLRLPRE